MSLILPRNGCKPGVDLHRRKWIMKKLVFLLTLMAFMMPTGFAVAGGGDGNRDSLRQAWKAVQAEEKKRLPLQRTSPTKPAPLWLHSRPSPGDSSELSWPIGQAIPIWPGSRSLLTGLAMKPGVAGAATPVRLPCRKPTGWRHARAFSTQCHEKE